VCGQRINWFQSLPSSSSRFALAARSSPQLGSSFGVFFLKTCVCIFPSLNPCLPLVGGDQDLQRSNCVLTFNVLYFFPPPKTKALNNFSGCCETLWFCVLDLCGVFQPSPNFLSTCVCNQLLQTSHTWSLCFLLRNCKARFQFYSVKSSINFHMHLCHCKLPVSCMCIL
jgi:hypothetical protein